MANVNCLRCRFRHEDNGNCTAVGGFCTAVPAAHCPLLREYLDTGMTPEEVLPKDKADEIALKLMRLADLESLCSYTRLRELGEADKDGRLVVLPCKVGGTLWVTGRDNVPREMELEAPDIRAVCTDEDNLCMSTCNRKPDGFCAYRLRNDGADIGKTVFLTREEAEKALEAKSND